MTSIRLPHALAACALIALGGVAAAQTVGIDRLASADADAGHTLTTDGTSSGAPPCASCHQENGAGNPDNGSPRLAGQPAWYLYKQLNDYASGVRDNPIMGPIAQALGDPDRANAAVYFAAAGAPYPPPPKTDAALVARGRTLATVGSSEKGVEGCANCHGPNGVGLAPGYPALAGQYADYIKAQLNAWRQGARKNAPEHVMEYIAKRLDDRDVEAVSQYFAALPQRAQTVAHKP